MATWYVTHPGKVGRRFTTVLDAKRKGVLDQKWDSKQPLIFAHMVLTNKLVIPKAREIRARIGHRLDICKRGIHAGLERC